MPTAAESKSGEDATARAAAADARDPCAGGAEMEVSGEADEMEVSGAAAEMGVSVVADEMEVSVGADEAPANEMEVSGAVVEAPTNGTGKLHTGTELRSATNGETGASAGGAEYEAPRKTPKAAPIRLLPKALPCGGALGSTSPGMEMEDLPPPA